MRVTLYPNRIAGSWGYLNGSHSLFECYFDGFMRGEGGAGSGGGGREGTVQSERTPHVSRTSAKQKVVGYLTRASMKNVFDDNEC